jgi:hypothetical protein
LTPLKASSEPVEGPYRGKVGLSIVRWLLAYCHCTRWRIAKLPNALDTNVIIKGC